MQDKGRFSNMLSGLVLLALGGMTTVTIADSGSAFMKGWQAYQAGRFQDAVAIWAPLARHGDANAQLNLGLLYDSGQGVPRDLVLAVSWYRKSAESGHAPAQYNLGQMYSEGRGVEQSHSDAVYWLQLAADQGLNDAREWLAEQDFVEPQAAVSHSSHDRHDFIDALDGVSTGTAWPVASGYAVTSNHIVADVESVELYDIAGRKRRAEILLRDESNDLALLHVHDARDFPPALPLSRSPGRLGSGVFTVGFPRIDVMGRTPKLTDGIISSVNGYRDDPASYQISVPIQPGNSGGPLLNMDGEVVGVVASMLGIVTENSGSRTLPNVAYAIKVSELQKLLAALPGTALSPGNLQETPATLADLAERIQQSVMIVVAAE